MMSMYDAGISRLEVSEGKYLQAIDQIIEQVQKRIF